MNQTLNSERKKMPNSENENNQEQEQSVSTPKKEPKPINSDMADIRKSIEERYANIFQKKEEKLTSQLQELENELNFERTIKPEIEKQFLANGGKKEYFNDFLKLNASKIETQDLEKSIVSLSKTTEWAFNSSGSVSSQITKGLDGGYKIDRAEFHPGTLYKKIK